MLVGKSKLLPEEIVRREEMLKALRPGLKLVFTMSDYHDEEETPYGFNEYGDEITLLFVVDKKPVMAAGTNKIVRWHDEWLTSGRYGLQEHGDYYLASMTKIKDET